MNTPWGQSDSSEKISRGVMFYGTPSHGGVLVRPSRQAEIPAALLAVGIQTKAGVWFEEDCHAAIPLYFFEEKTEERKASIKSWQPDAWTAATGEVVDVSESYVLQKRAEAEAQKDMFVGYSAFGDWCVTVPKGMVGLFCRKEATGEEKKVLVPKASYRMNKAINEAEALPWEGPGPGYGN